MALKDLPNLDSILGIVPSGKLAWEDRIVRARKYLEPFEKQDVITVDPNSDDPDEFVQLFRDHSNKAVFNRKLQVR